MNIPLLLIIIISNVAMNILIWTHHDKNGEPRKYYKWISLVAGILSIVLAIMMSRGGKKKLNAPVMTMPTGQ